MTTKVSKSFLFILSRNKKLSIEKNQYIATFKQDMEEDIWMIRKT